MKNEKNTKEKQFMIKNILLKILIFLNYNICDDVNLHATFYLIFAIFLRCEKFIYTTKNLKNLNFKIWHLTKNSIILYSNYLIIILFVFKIDFFKQNITLTMIIINNETCAIKFLKYLFKNFSTKSNVLLFT